MGEVVQFVSPPRETEQNRDVLEQVRMMTPVPAYIALGCFVNALRTDDQGGSVEDSAMWISVGLDLLEEAGEAPTAPILETLSKLGTNGAKRRGLIEEKRATDGSTTS